MKNIFFLIWGVCVSLVLIAQPNDTKRDAVWLTGASFEEDPTGEYNGNIKCTFGLDNMSIEFQYAPLLKFNETCAGISDTTGKMLFYTNGAIIVDSTYQIMENSEDFNQSSFTTYWEQTGWGLRLPQGAIVLPMPDNSNKYYIFYVTAYLVTEGALPLHLRYSVVDMSLNNGLGVVTEKKQDIVIDSLSFNGLTACRHANGRDWWIMMPQLSGYAYYLFLLTPQGVQDMGMQFIGDDLPETLGQSVFTPDGRHYVRFHVGGNDGPKCPLDIYDFDRCTGELSNFKRVWIDQLAVIAGLAVSPNSRFAYCFTGNALYQYDMELDTTIHIADYDGFADPEGTVLAATLYQAQLAPNGKIYACASNGVRYLHVINNPNEAGLACNFVQHGVALPVYNGFTVPNFPYFRLGREVGSGCDTLYNALASPQVLPLEGGLEGGLCTVLPNPANEQLFISSNVQTNATFVLYDVLGKEVARQALNTPSFGGGKGEATITTKHLPSGIYLYQIIDPQNQTLQYGKLSILH